MNTTPGDEDLTEGNGQVEDDDDDLDDDFLDEDLDEDIDGDLDDDDDLDDEDLMEEGDDSLF